MTGKKESLLESEFTKRIGKQLKRHRLQNNLTQKQVAEILDIDEQYYGQAERGAKRLSLKKLVAFCAYFHISLDAVVAMDTAQDAENERKEFIQNIAELLPLCTGEELRFLRMVVQRMVSEGKTEIQKGTY